MPILRPQDCLPTDLYLAQLFKVRGAASVIVQTPPLVKQTNFKNQTNTFPTADLIIAASENFLGRLVYQHSHHNGCADSPV